MDQHTSTVSYTPLGPKEIRVLEIHPSASPDAVVSCHLLKTKLRHGIKYSALSYVWGPPIPTEYIAVNGATIPVTKNLGKALRRLRNLGAHRRLEPGFIAAPAAEAAAQSERQSRLPRAFRKLSLGSSGPEEPLRLWVDALCINQDDVAERNQQVAQMASVYRNARQVISWLGEVDDKRIDLGLDLVQRIHRALGPPSKVTYTKPDSISVQGGLQWIAKTPDVNQLNAGGGSTNAHWEGVFHLGASPYWTRVWIVQEIAVARSLHDAILLCGNACASFAQYAAFGAFLDRLPYAAPAQWEGIHETLRLGITSRGYSLLQSLDQEVADIRSGRLSPPVLLSTAITHAATDPRDMVYGYRSVTTRSTSVVDYSRPVRDVYLDWYRDAHYAFLLLGTAFHYSGVGQESYSNAHNLPSWLPDLSRLNGVLKEVVVPHRTALVDHGYLQRGLLSQVKPELDYSINGVPNRLCPEVPGAMEVLTLPFGTVESVIKGSHAAAWEPRHASGAFKALERLTKAFGLSVTYGIGKEAPILCALYDVIHRGEDGFDGDLISESFLKEGLGVEMFLRGMRHAAEGDAVPASLLQTFGAPNCTALGLKLCAHALGHLTAPECEERFPPAVPFDVMTAASKTARIHGLDYTDWHAQFGLCERTSYFRTVDGRLGIGPRHVQPGDRLVAINPSTLPILLRSRTSGWSHVGTCYVAGLSATDLTSLHAANDIDTEPITLL